MIGHDYKNIFVTGPPRCGKSTLIERLILKIGKPATGFFTREIREKGRRIAFSITTLDGKRGVLAHKNMKGKGGRRKGGRSFRTCLKSFQP